MRSHIWAESLLSLVAPRDRAASAVGDLIEEAATRGPWWFWRSVALVAVRLLGRDLVSSSMAMAAAAAFAWFLYMAISLVFALVGYVVLTLAWGLAYVLTHHTGYELLADLLRVRFDWPPIPTWATAALQAVVFFAVTPFCIGRGSAAYWRGHELSLVIITLVIWLGMSVFVPFVGMGVRTTPATVPILAAFLLLGLLSARASVRETQGAERRGAGIE